MKIWVQLFLIFLAQFVLSFLFSWAGIWYVQFIPAFFTGYLAKAGKSSFTVIGPAGALGTVAMILIVDGSAGFAEASMASTIIGMGSPLPLLLITALFAYVLSSFGSLVGTSVVFEHTEIAIK